MAFNLPPGAPVSRKNKINHKSTDGRSDVQGQLQVDKSNPAPPRSACTDTGVTLHKVQVASKEYQKINKQMKLNQHIEEKGAEQDLTAKNRNAGRACITVTSQPGNRIH